jgi:hypothetical protein
MRRFLLALVLLLLGAAPLRADAPVVIGHSVVALTGPWRFHVGDDPSWKDAGYDDSKWETVDLTPKPGARDPDVGLKGYVPGWGARGHPKYVGYGWYRMRIDVTAPQGARLALAGPPYVDGSYQIYLDGRLLGGSGDFSHNPPRVYARDPRLIRLPTDAFAHGAATIAVRVYSDPAQALSGDDAGGIRIAPSLGEATAVADQVRGQWTDVFWGYVVEGVEPVLFLALAGLALLLGAFDRGLASACRWMALALVLAGAQRFEQIVLFWMQAQTIPTYAVVRGAVLTPLMVGTWTQTWLAWFAPVRGAPRARIAWTTVAVAVLTTAYVVCELVQIADLYAAHPHLPGPWLGTALMILHLGYLALMLFAAGRGLLLNRPRPVLSVIAMLVLCVGLFAGEVSKLGVPGIWFPWGVGVSRTQYAYAVFDVVLLAVLVVRLLSFTPDRKSTVFYGGAPPHRSS